MAKKALSILIILAAFGACGELDTVLSSTGTYQVKALVNDVSLDTCSLISAGDKVQPYFASSIANDPDVTGLIVYLQNPQGVVLGGKIRYTLNSSADPVLAAGNASAELPDSGATPADTENSTDKPDGGTEKPAETGVKNDAKAETVIRVKRLDKDLPSFVLPENIDIGQYVLVFQVLGGKENLHRIEKAVYYLKDAKFSLKDIQMYLPGQRESRLVPAGSTVMLEAKLDFDAVLDPYIVWYNGKKIVNKGSFADGAGSILWKAPDQNGFHTLRAEVFPFHIEQKIAGNSREISLPVSSKTGDLNLLSGDNPGLLHWYQFEGSLKDSKFPGVSEWDLKAADSTRPLWRSTGYYYGLAAGPDNAYAFPPVTFPNEINPADEAAGHETRQFSSGQFLFRFKPVSDGTLFSARFGTEEPVQLELNLRGASLILTLTAPGMTETAAEPLESVEQNEYINASVIFSMQPNLVTARIEMEKIFPSKEIVLAISESRAISGSKECKLTLGGQGIAAETKPDNMRKNKTEEISNSPDINQQAAAPTAIWDEFALLYLIPEPDTAEAAEAEEETPAISAAPDSETADDFETP
jgi:hypothetical protein